MKIDIKRYKYKERSKPPKTIRHCDICGKKTKWIFNPLIRHSQCEECGFRKISDMLINYMGRIMEIENDKKIKNKNTYVQSYLTKLLNKKVKCTLLNLDIIEGTLVGYNPYEIAMLVEDEQVIIFKHGISKIKECKQIAG